MYAHFDQPMDWSDHINKELWKVFKKGDRRAFAELFSRFYPRLFRYGISLVSDKEAVKDGIQELFLSLWRNRIHLAEANSVEYYLLISLKRILLKERKNVNIRQEKNFKYIEDIIQFEPGLESGLIRIESEQDKYVLYQKALKILTFRQKEALRLRMEFGLDNKEIADVLELSEKRIRNIIYEATKKMREWVASYEKLNINMN